MKETFLWSALRPHFALAWRSAIGWGERLLDRHERRDLRNRFEYQGANIPVGASEARLAEHRGLTVRFRGLW